MLTSLTLLQDLIRVGTPAFDDPDSAVNCFWFVAVRRRNWPAPDPLVVLARLFLAVDDAELKRWWLLGPADGETGGRLPDSVRLWGANADVSADDRLGFDVDGEGGVDNDGVREFSEDFLLITWPKFKTQCRIGSAQRPWMKAMNAH